MSCPKPADHFLRPMWIKNQGIRKICYHGSRASIRDNQNPCLHPLDSTSDPPWTAQRAKTGLPGPDQGSAGASVLGHLSQVVAGREAQRLRHWYCCSSSPGSLRGQQNGSSATVQLAEDHLMAYPGAVSPSSSSSLSLSIYLSPSCSFFPPPCLPIFPASQKQGLFSPKPIPWNQSAMPTQGRHVQGHRYGSKVWAGVLALWVTTDSLIELSCTTYMWVFKQVHTTHWWIRAVIEPQCLVQGEALDRARQVKVRCVYGDVH